MRHMTEQEYTRYLAAWQECEDYIAATKEMRTRQLAVQEAAYRGSEYARGWLGCIREWTAALLEATHRRDGE